MNCGIGHLWMRSCQVVALLATVFMPGQAAAKDVPITLAILEFGSNNTSAADASTITAFVRNAVVQSQSFTVIEKKNMQALLAEQAFQQTGCTTSECAVKLGRLLNAKKIIVGEYSMLSDARFLTASLVDVETGTVERTGKVREFEPKSADVAAETLVSQLLGRSRNAPDRPSTEHVSQLPTSVEADSVEPHAGKRKNKRPGLLSRVFGPTPTQDSTIVTPQVPGGRSSKRVAVANFASAGGILTADCDAAVSRLRTEVAKHREAIVSEKQEMEEVMTGTYFTKTDCTSVECAVKMGKLLKVHYVVVGRFEKLMGKLYFNVRLINVATNAVVTTEIVRGADMDEMNSGIIQMARKLAMRL